MTELKDIILSILERHRGRENAIKGHALLYQVNRESYPDRIGERKMREVIEEELPHICSGPTGYFIPANIGEVNKAVKYLESYIGSLAHRRKIILKTYPNAEQGELFGRQP
jgi:hypothetical protein